MIRSLRGAWRIALGVCLGAAALLPAAAGTDTARRIGGMYRYWSADQGSDLRDYILYWAQNLNPTVGFHVQYEPGGSIRTLDS